MVFKLKKKQGINAVNGVWILTFAGGSEIASP